MVSHTHVDDVFAAWNSAFAYIIDPLLDAIVTGLHMSRREFPFIYCGRDFEHTESRIYISQCKMCSNLELVDIERSRRPQKEAPINDEERSAYRSLLGQLLWVAQHTRADVACAVCEHAQRTNCVTVADLYSLNNLAKHVVATAEQRLCIPRGRVDVLSSAVLGFGDSSFATGENVKSQYGVVVGLTRDYTKVINGFTASSRSWCSSPASFDASCAAPWLPRATPSPSARKPASGSAWSSPTWSASGALR